MLDGLRGESSIAELCRHEGIAEGLYYAWSKEFLRPASAARRVTPRERRPVASSRTCGDKAQEQGLLRRGFAPNRQRTGSTAEHADFGASIISDAQND